jgi:ankyrin repeat protein
LRRGKHSHFNLLAPLIGSTPYMLAAKFVEAEIMRALKTGGADPNLAMPNGATPVMLAAGLGSGDRQSRRGIAVIDFGKVEPENQVFEAVKAAVELGGDVNAANQTGDTALHSAAAKGYDTVVQFLADHGAQLNAKNKRGQTPLAVLLAGGPRGRARPPAAAVDPDSDEAVRASAHPSTVALLRRLGAAE